MFSQQRNRILFVFLVLAHERRRALPFNVTANPTAVWTAQQNAQRDPRNVRQDDRSARLSNGGMSKHFALRQPRWLTGTRVRPIIGTDAVLPGSGRRSNPARPILARTGYSRTTTTGARSSRTSRHAAPARHGLAPPGYAHRGRSGSLNRTVYDCTVTFSEPLPRSALITPEVALEVDGEVSFR